jgi:hypothetical protein
MNGKVRSARTQEGRHIYVNPDLFCDACKDKLIEVGWDYTKIINQVSGLRARPATDDAIRGADAIRRGEGLTWKQAAMLVGYKSSRAFKRRVKRLT